MVGYLQLGEPVLLLSLLVSLYVVLGITWTLYCDPDLVLETIGRVVGLTFVVITFPWWAGRAAYQHLIGATA